MLRMTVKPTECVRIYDPAGALLAVIEVEPTANSKQVRVGVGADRAYSIRREKREVVEGVQP